MRRSRFRRGSGSPDLDDDNWFRKRNLTRSRKKRARVAHRFHIKQNAARVRIVAEMINQIAPVHIGHGTDGNERAEPELCRPAPIENRRAKRAALTDESNIARQCQRVCERRVQTDVGQHHPDTVRADDPHLPASFENLLFEFSTSRSALLESGRDNHCTFHIRSRAFGDDPRNCRGRRSDYSEIDFLWHISELLRMFSAREASSDLDSLKRRVQ